MKAQLLNEQQGNRTLVVVLGANLTAVGGFSRAVLGYFDRQRKGYKRIAVDEYESFLARLLAAGRAPATRRAAGPRSVRPGSTHSQRTPQTTGTHYDR